MISMTDIKAMSKKDRLKAIDLIWSSLTDSERDLPTPPWHKNVLDRRLASVKSGHGTFIGLDQVKRRLAVKKP